MALTEIGARLRLAGAPAFSRDARKGADSLDRFGRSAQGADRHLSRLERAAKRSRSALAGVGKGLAFGGIGLGIAGVGALSAGLVQGFRDASALETMLAKTRAVVKSTGGAAGVSAEHVLKMSDNLESLSTIDQGAILNGENLLLTFTRLHNGVGKGNDIFDQATLAMVNLSTAMGSDPQAAAIQLGKALNDPVKGVTALSKVGVSFTAEQKKQIKTLVASGKTMDAQKVILKELNTEFGGAAKAAGSGFEGAMFRAKDAFSDLLRDTAKPLLPGVTRKLEDLATFMNNKGTPAVLNFVKGFQDNSGAGGRLRQDLVDIGKAAKDAGKWANDYVLPPLRWMAKHPDAMKGIAATMAAYKIAVWGAAGGQKALATWMVLTGKAAPGAAAGTAATAASAAAFATSITAVAGVAGGVGLAYLFGQAAKDSPNTLAGTPTAPVALPKQKPVITFNGKQYYANGQGEVGAKAGAAPNPRLAPGRSPDGPVLTPRVRRKVPDLGGGRGTSAPVRVMPTPVRVEITTNLDGKVIAKNVIGHIEDGTARK